MRILTAGHYYHAYNEGAGRSPIFLDHRDYERFLALLYIANNVRPFLSRDRECADLFALKRTGTLVEIVAYCLMPDHFHIAWREREPGAGGQFMRKLSTAYAMYYNRRHGRTGALFQGTYRARPAPEGGRLRQIIRQIHLDPFQSGRTLLAKDLRRGKEKAAVECASRYRYSSMRDYLGEQRMERAILSIDQAMD